MGFENRKSTRVKLDSPVCYWLDGAPSPSLWGQAINLSETGLAFHGGQALEPGAELAVELSLAGQGQALKLPAKVVHCHREAAGEARYQVRVSFAGLENEDRNRLRRHILQVAEPSLGWGKTYFPGKQAIEVVYRELAAAEQKLWLEKRDYLSLREVGYLKQYQGHLEQALGSKAPESFRLLGTKPLKAHAEVWLELETAEGRLHFLAKVLWCHGEPDGRAESGLSLVAFHKEEALYLERKP
jgi:hypothetical protein